MKRSILVSLFCVGVTLTAALAFAFPPNTVKVNPDGVDYPLIRSVAYPSRNADPFERYFGIRRWFNPIGQEADDAKKTHEEVYGSLDKDISWHRGTFKPSWEMSVQEAMNQIQSVPEIRGMFQLYGGYGVLGSGEDVFTNAAAQWRRHHRGR